ncbi:MAG: hypothetical protein D6679_09420 [Candidatus Hydrogenedentota bacterium]|nr:MAG: hypothetical protein D6679_09420 [Candidatus Hydrogenedentota bacterium]
MDQSYFRSKIPTIALLLSLTFGFLGIEACGGGGEGKKETPPVLVLADFDSARPPANIGGAYSVWMVDAEDTAQWCALGYSSDYASGGKGYALRLDYDVDDVKPAYNGFWLKLQNLDASEYDALSMKLAGDPRGCTKKIIVELKNPFQTGKYTVVGIDTYVREFRIPLGKFKGLTDFRSLTEMTIVFSDIGVTAKTGTLYVDDIRLLRTKG